MTGLPGVRVEMAFASLPDAEQQQWLDVTEFVRGELGVFLERGRSDELSAVEPGQGRFTLDNSDGRFTYGNSSSPYWPNVLPLRRVRVVLTVPDFSDPEPVTESWPFLAPAEDLYPADDLYPRE